MLRSWLCQLADARGVKFLLEQPTGSRMYAVPEIRHAVDVISAERMTVYLGAFGFSSLKPLTLYTTHDMTLVRSLLGAKRSSATAFLATVPESQPLTYKHRKVNASSSKGWGNGQWVSGRTQLKASSEYPVAFCDAVSRLVMHGSASTAGSTST